MKLFECVFEQELVFLPRNDVAYGLVTGFLLAALVIIFFSFSLSLVFFFHSSSPIIETLTKHYSIAILNI